MRETFSRAGPTSAASAALRKPVSAIAPTTSFARARAPDRLPVGARRLGALTSPASIAACDTVSFCGVVLK